MSTNLTALGWPSPADGDVGAGLLEHKDQKPFEHFGTLENIGMAEPETGVESLGGSIQLIVARLSGNLGNADGHQEAREEGSQQSDEPTLETENVRTPKTLADPSARAKRKSASDLLVLIPLSSPIGQVALIKAARASGINEKYARKFLSRLVAEKLVRVRKVPRPKAKAALGYVRRAEALIEQAVIPRRAAHHTKGRHGDAGCI